METILQTEKPMRSGEGVFEGAWEQKSMNSSEISDRTGRRRKRKNAGSVIWRGMILGMLICLLVELGTAVGIPVIPFFESAAERILAVIPQESIGQFQNILYHLAFEWTADSLPVCGYSAAVSGSAGDESGGILASEYAAILWSVAAGEPLMKTAQAADGATGNVGMYTDWSESELGTVGEGGDSQSGLPDTNKKDNMADEGEKTGGEGEDVNGSGTGESNGEDEVETGESDGEGGNGTGESNGEDGAETGESDGEGGSTKTGADTFLMPTVTGKLYTAEALTYSFLTSNFYNISSSTVVYESELNGSLLSVPLTLNEIAEEPQILIYHTHSHEFFTDSDTSDLNTGIVGVGAYLAELLEGYGYSVLHLTDQFDYVDGVLDRSKAYTYAGVRLKEILAEYPSIEVMIDLHRDGVSEDLHLVTEINGKSTAMIMFFNGMSRTTSGNISYLPNTNLEANLAFSLQLKVKAEAYYPGFTRKNYIKPYRYNLHLLERSLLIEAGAQTNTFEEVQNAMEPLAVLLHIELSGLE